MFTKKNKDLNNILFTTYFSHLIGFKASYAFDNNNDTYWYPDSYGPTHTSENQDYIAYEFPVAVRIQGNNFFLKLFNLSYCNFDWSIQRDLAISPELCNWQPILILTILFLIGCAIFHSQEGFA